WIQRRSPGSRFGVSEMGKVMSPRLTCTSILGPARSNADPSACKPVVARHKYRSGRSKLRRMETILRSGWSTEKRIRVKFRTNGDGHGTKIAPRGRANAEDGP